MIMVVQICNPSPMETDGKFEADLYYYNNTLFQKTRQSSQTKHSPKHNNVCVHARPHTCVCRSMRVRSETMASSIVLHTMF